MKFSLFLSLVYFMYKKILSLSFPIVFFCENSVHKNQDVFFSSSTIQFHFQKIRIESSIVGVFLPVCSGNMGKSFTAKSFAKPQIHPRLTSLISLPFGVFLMSNKIQFLFIDMIKIKDEINTYSRQVHNKHNHINEVS